MLSLVFVDAHSRPSTSGASASNNNRDQTAPGTPPKTQTKPLTDSVNCPLCEQNVRSVVFQCGHSCCKDCSTSRVQSSCHVCGAAIQQRINLF